MPVSMEPAVKAAFDRHPAPLRDALLEVRGLILATACNTPRVGPIVETLKWGEPAYLPRAPRVGTTVRLDAVKGSKNDYAVLFHCQTTLVESFRVLYPDVFRFEGRRAIVLTVGEPLPTTPLSHCIARALTYHLPPA